MGGWGERTLATGEIFDQNTEDEEQTVAQIIPATISRISSPSKKDLHEADEKQHTDRRAAGWTVGWTDGRTSINIIRAEFVHGQRLQQME